MNKESIIKVLKKYNLDKNDYMVISGASMVLLGLKELAHDIDIAVTPKLYEYLLNNYDCKLEREVNGVKVYFINGEINFSTNYYTKEDIMIINGIPIQNEISIRNLKLNLNRDKDKKDIEEIDKYISDLNINSLALAYLGDSIYEVYIRKFLIDNNIVKVNDLQASAIKYVSAKGQAKYLNELINNNLLTITEKEVALRARNHKCNHKPKNCDIITYKSATGFEAIIGYLYLKNNITRIEDIINYIIGR